jgi:hypothetical protein
MYVHTQLSECLPLIEHEQSSPALMARSAGRIGRSTLHLTLVPVVRLMRDQLQREVLELPTNKSGDEIRDSNAAPKKYKTLFRYIGIE